MTSVSMQYILKKIIDAFGVEIFPRTHLFYTVRILSIITIARIHPVMSVGKHFFLDFFGMLCKICLKCVMRLQKIVHPKYFVLCPLEVLAEATVSEYTLVNINVKNICLITALFT